MSFINEQFQRKARKSLSQKGNPDYFEEESKNLKRFSQLTQNKIIPEFYSNIDKKKLQSRSSLPVEFRFDKLSYNKANNLDENLFSKRSSNSKDMNSSLDKTSSKNTLKNKSFIDSFQGGIKDIKVVWKNRVPDKEEEKEKDPLDKQYENIENFLNHLNEKFKVNENIEVNYSSSTLGFTGSKKSFSKSDDKNTKVNLKNIIHNDKIDLKKNAACVILTDINNAEKKENKLDILIKTMEEYKDIIIEKMLCKNFQDRLMLNIFICLSQLSFKLYNCIENKTKFENLRKYICSLTDDMKYNLINNPNFTISIINQKFIDIDSIDKNLLINNDDEDDYIKENDNNPINLDSSINFMSKTNKNLDTSHNSKYDSESNKNKVNFYNFFDEEIIYDYFEEFNNDDGNDKDLYMNPNLFYEIDTKSNMNNNNNFNNFEQNPGFNKQSLENNVFSQKNQKTKTRRNATHRMLLNQRTARIGNINNNTTHYVNTNNYDFHIIDINGKIDYEDSNDECMDSDDDCIEVQESYKFERQKLIFFEDYVKDKDKRRLTKIDSIELRPDSKFMKNKARLIELNEISYKNIIDIINDDPSLLPNHQLNMNPKDIAEFIKQREKILDSDKDSSKVEEKEEDEKDEKNIFNSNDSSYEENQSKEVKRFKNINSQIEKGNNGAEYDENDDDNEENENDENFYSSKTETENENKNYKILIFDNDSNEEN